MMSWMSVRKLGCAVMLQLSLVSAGFSTQQYPVFTNPSSDVSEKPSGSLGKAATKITATTHPTRRPLQSYQYNGFITVDDSRWFIVNAKPLSHIAELKLVSVLNAGRSLVLQHNTRGRINLHLGQTSADNSKL